MSFSEVRLKLLSLKEGKSVFDKNYELVKIITADLRTFELKYSEYKLLVGIYKCSVQEIRERITGILKGIKTDDVFVFTFSDRFGILPQFHFWSLYDVKKTEYESLKKRGAIDSIEEQLMTNPYQFLSLRLGTSDSICTRYGLKIPREREKCVIAKYLDGNVYGEVAEKTGKRKFSEAWTCTPHRHVVEKFGSQYPGEKLAKVLQETKDTYYLKYKFDCWYTPVPYRNEQNVSTLLRNATYAINNFTTFTEDQYLLDVEKKELKNWSKFESGQKEGFLTALKHKVSIISGGAGSGKSFVLSTMIEYLEKLGISFQVLTFTGKAASRVKELCGEDNENIKTIHKFLCDGLYSGFELPSVLLFDESSMIPVSLLSKIYLLYQKQLKSIEEEEIFLFGKNDYKEQLPQIVFFGDQNQLPSIGYGNILEDLIKSKSIPHIHFKTQKRFDESLAKIFERIPQGLNISTNDKFMTTKEPLMSHLKAGKYNDGFTTTILCHSNEEKEKDNIICQEYFNPPSSKLKEHFYKTKWNEEFTVREGDRIMMLQNNYEWNIMNGEEGKIIDIGNESFSAVFGKSSNEKCVSVYYDKNSASKSNNENFKGLDIFFPFLEKLAKFQLKKETLDGWMEKIFEIIGKNPDFKDISKSKNMVKKYIKCLKARSVFPLKLEDFYEAHTDTVSDLKEKFATSLHISDFCHSWAMTFHKSQGSEWKNVIIKCPKRPQRKMIYTGFTRTRDFCVLLGDEPYQNLSYLNSGISNAPPPRYSNLDKLV